MLSSKEIPPIAATFLVGDQFTPVGLRMGWTTQLYIGIIYEL